MKSTQSPKSSFIDDAIIQEIVKKFPDLNAGLIKIVDKAFHKIFTQDCIAHSLRNQYLAHFIRSIEIFLREQTGNKLFQIVVKVRKLDDPIPLPGQALHIKHKLFVVYVHPHLDAKQQRAVLAHELGHLLVCELLDRRYQGKPESIASLFGILAIMDKSKFYQDKAQDFIYNANDMICEFSRIMKQGQGIYNTS